MQGISSKLSCEFLATFTLTFIGAGSIVTTAWTGGTPGLIGIALAHGLALAIAVSATMNISGAHVNPAVTLALFTTGRIKAGPALGYIIAQCGGSTLAAFVLLWVFRSLGPISASIGIDGESAIRNCLLGTPNFLGNITPTMAIVVEGILTFLLVFAVFGTAVDARAPRIGGFGIGLAVCMDILVGGPLTGAAMNPARTLGPLIAGGEITARLWSQHWVYWVGPVLGATLAAIVYDTLILRPSKGPSA